MRRDEERLHDILEHTDSALAAVEGKDRSTFDTDPILQNAIRYCLIIIGEAASNIPEELQNKYPNVLWKDIRRLRNLIAHHYFGVDLDILWLTVSQDLLPLRTRFS
jgi:uncharacterized protein with HEPN domain